jgi:hypothetical protein
MMTFGMKRVGRRAFAVTATVAMIGAVATAASTQASASPTVRNSNVPCTKTIHKTVASLAVTSGFVCVDGLDGGAVTGTIHVANGAGLYLEETHVGAILADHSKVVWACSTSVAHNVQISNAGYFAPSEGSVVLGINCPVAVEGNGVWVGGSVSLNGSRSQDEFNGTVVGDYSDTNNAGAISPYYLSVNIAGTFDSDVSIDGAQGQVYLYFGDYYGPVTLSDLTLYAGVYQNTFHAGVNVVNNSAGIQIEKNAIHGGVSVVNSPNTSVTNNTTF